jgi:hypothetical protein
MRVGRTKYIKFSAANLQKSESVFVLDVREYAYDWMHVVYPRDIRLDRHQRLIVIMMVEMSKANNQNN